MQTSNGFPFNTFKITNAGTSCFVIPKSNCKTLFLGFGNGNEVKTLLFLTKTTSFSSNGSKERKRRLRFTTTTAATRIRASLLESPVLWAGRLCIFYALLKSGLAGSLSNPLLSDLERNGGSGDGVGGESGDMGFSKWLNSIQAKPVKEAADRRKLVSKWHPTTKGTLKRNYRVPSKSEGRRLLKAIASLLSDDDHFVDATSHKGCQIRRESAHGESVCCNNVRALFDELPTPHLIVEITPFPAGPLTEKDYTKAEKLGPDLRAFVPAVLLGETEPKLNEQSAKTQEQQTEPVPDSDQGQRAMQDTGEVPIDSGALLEGKSTEKGKEKEEKDKEKSKDPEKEKGKEKDTDRKGDTEKEKLKSLDGTNLDALLQRLPGCVSRDLIDQLTVEFCYLNSKANRKKLVRALFNVPRTSLELLPYYSRMVATLSTCMKDVSSMLLQMLEEEFNFLINKKDQMNIETKIRNIRFIGELCKFKIASSGLVFSCLKACLDDFMHHNIDVACNLLETCGRFLYRSPETTVRMANMLEILMRLKNVKNLDPRHSTLVENAYYLCKPPERSARIAKVRPPLHQYIRKLLFSDLDKSTIEHVLRQLRKLPWCECEPYLLKCFMKVHKGKYGQIHLIASLTAGLSRYHDEFAVAVVDEVLEEIRLGLELNDYGMQQRRIAHMRFLGELYNYEHVDSSVIFETLYLILVYGHGSPEQDLLDPPEDCFRMRMIITLLETCGHYFDRGSSKRKLDRFLVHFQRYILSKGALPLDIEFDLQDLFADLRPNMARYSSIEEVNAALVELEEHEHSISIDKTSIEKLSDIEKASSRSSFNPISANRQSVVNGNEENGGVDDDLGDSGSDSGSDTLDPEGQDEEELDEENHEDERDSDEEDDDDGGAPASDEDDEVHVRQKMVEVDPQEEANFDQELRAVLQESMEQRRQELRGRPTLNMMIPMNVFEGSTKDHGRGTGGESGDEVLDEEAGVNREIRVKVLVKRGNKQQTKQMFIPRDCSLVQSTKQKEAAELEEKQDIKRLVLEYNDREEEELNGLGTQTLNHMQGGGNRISSRGHIWEGTSGKAGGTPHRHHNYSSGVYYSRKK